MTDEQPEWVIARLHPHARRLFWPALLLVLVAGGTGFGYGRLPEEWQNLAILGAAGVIVFFGCLVPLLRWTATTYTITNERTVLRSGILVRSRQEVPHWRVQEVILRRGAGQAMFGAGDVLLDTGASRPVVLADVPSPKLVVRALDDLLDGLPDDDSDETWIG